MKNPSFLAKSISYKSARISQCWPDHVQTSNQADTKAWNAISKDAETGADFWRKYIVHQGVIFTHHFAQNEPTGLPLYNPFASFRSSKLSLDSPKGK